MIPFPWAFFLSFFSFFGSKLSKMLLFQILCEFLWFTLLLHPSRCPNSPFFPCIPSTHFRDHSSFIPDWVEKACTISCCSWERVCMVLEVSVGSWLENALWVSLGVASLTNSSSFTMHRLKGKWALRQVDECTTPHPQQWSCSHCHSATRFLPYPYCACRPPYPDSWAGASTPPTEPTFAGTVYQPH